MALTVRPPPTALAPVVLCPLPSSLLLPPTTFLPPTTYCPSFFLLLSPSIPLPSSLCLTPTTLLPPPTTFLPPPTALLLLLPPSSLLLPSTPVPGVQAGSSVATHTRKGEMEGATIVLLEKVVTEVVSVKEQVEFLPSALGWKG